MKAITLWQPWATLLAIGAKKYETRSWATNYRGPIAIHAAQRPAHKIFSELIEYQTAKTMFECLRTYDIWFPADLPHGCIIATAELIGCHQIVRYGGRGMSSQGPGWLDTEDGIYLPTEQELMFGDWTPGRYAWELTNVKLLPKPIRAKGAQGLWNWDESDPDSRPLFE